MARFVVVLVLAVAALSVLWWSQQLTDPYAVSGYVEADKIRLGSRVGGRVKAVNVEEGQTAKAGQVLVELEPYNLRELLAQAEAELAARRAVLEKLRAGYRPEVVQQARARRDSAQALLDKAKAGPRPLEIQIKADQLDAAQADLAWAESDATRVRNLYDQNQASKEELDQSVRRLDTARAAAAAASNALMLAKEGTRAEEIAEAEAKLAEAAANVKELENGYRAEEIAEAEATVSAAQAAVAQYQRMIEELQIVAPTAGEVEAIDLEPGDLIGANAPVLTLLDQSHQWVRAYVPENRVALNVGQKVQLRADAFGERVFQGEVSFVARQAEFTPTNVQTPEERIKQMFRIKVDILDGQEQLRPGMSVDVFLEPIE